MWWQIATGVIAALGGGAGVVAFINGRATRKQLQAQAQKLIAESEKSDADAVEVLARTAVALLNPAKEQVKELQRELKSVRDELRKALRDLTLTKEQLVQAQVEMQGLRNQMDQMSKELSAANEENARLREANP